MSGGDDGFPFAAQMDRKLPLMTGGDNGFPLVSAEGKYFDFGKQTNSIKTCGLVDFSFMQVIEGKMADTWFLIVGGPTRTKSMKVDLRPRHYVDAPEYWEIEVLGCVAPVVLPTAGEFVETLSITDYIGNKGIEVVGATRTKIWQRP
jgi:hypothetical protein